MELEILEQLSNVQLAYECCLEAGVAVENLRELVDKASLAKDALDAGNPMLALSISSAAKIDISEESIKDLGVRAWNAIRNLVEKLIDFFKSLVAKIKAMLSHKSEVVETVNELRKEAADFVNGEGTEALDTTSETSVKDTIDKYMDAFQELIDAARKCSHANYTMATIINHWIETGDDKDRSALSNALQGQNNAQMRLDDCLDGVNKILESVADATAPKKVVLKIVGTPDFERKFSWFSGARSEILRTMTNGEPSAMLNRIAKSLEHGAFKGYTEDLGLITAAIRQIPANTQHVMRAFHTAEHRLSKFLKR